MTFLHWRPPPSQKPAAACRTQSKSRCQCAMNMLNVCRILCECTVRVIFDLGQLSFHFCLHQSSRSYFFPHQSNFVHCSFLKLGRSVNTHANPRSVAVCRIVGSEQMARWESRSTCCRLLR